jgi:(p)ppGpp synthase/HD superfamily hydrolase
MNNENILKKAVEFATEQHKGQKRKNGEDYITHPLAVREITKEKIKEDLNPYGIGALLVELLALFHDISEDVEKYKNKEVILINDFNELVDNSLDGYAVDNLVTGLILLNRSRYSNYMEYILNILESDNYYAKVVKLSDLKHNMSDLNEGSLKDKYRLAEYILTR